MEEPQQLPSQQKLETVSGIDKILEGFDKLTKDTVDASSKWANNVQKFTGHNPRQAITPLDVVKIVQKVFFAGSDK